MNNENERQQGEPIEAIQPTIRAEPTSDIDYLIQQERNRIAFTLGVFAAEPPSDNPARLWAKALVPWLRSGAPSHAVPPPPDPAAAPPSVDEDTDEDG